MSDIVQQLIDGERIRSIESLMKTMKLTVPHAMDALGIPSNEQAKYAAQLHGKQKGESQNVRNHS